MDDESIIMIIDAITLLVLFPSLMMGNTPLHYVSFFHINTFIIFMDFIVIFLISVLVLRRYFGE